jgi:predicted porin
MNKKSAVALAVGAVFTMPVLAQTTGTTVEIYGRLYPQLTSAEATGATDPADNEKRRFGIDTSNSRVGFRGTEKLGGGMAAIWQIESRVRFDSGAGNLWAGNRDSFLGLSGGWGTFKFGNFDTIYKTYGAAVGNFFGAGSGNFVSSSNVLSELGAAPGGGEDGDGRDCRAAPVSSANCPGQGTGSGFHVRANNSIQYETPEFGGFQAGIQFSPDEFKGNTSRPRNRDINANLWSTGVKYEAGPVYASVQYERHKDWFDASTNFDAGTSTAFGTLGTTTTDSKDQAWRASGKFAVTPQHRLTGDFARMEWKESGPAGSGTYKRNAWAVGWEAGWGGPWRTEITYTRANKGDCTATGCSTDGLEGKQIAAGIGYSLSKRTTLYGIAARLTNGTNAAFNNTAELDVNNGADTKQFALGMVHSF